MKIPMISYNAVQVLSHLASFLEVMTQKVYSFKSKITGFLMSDILRSYCWVKLIFGRQVVIREIKKTEVPSYCWKWSVLPRNACTFTHNYDAHKLPGKLVGVGGLVRMKNYSIADILNQTALVKVESKMEQKEP